jgi:hypothetical protein
VVPPLMPRTTVWGARARGLKNLDKSFNELDFCLFLSILINSINLFHISLYNNVYIHLDGVVSSVYYD